MRSFSLTCICLLAALSLSAQQNFVPGTVLLRNGDSIQGQIDYRKWDMNPLQITVRENGGEKIYKPADIKGFRITSNGEIYLSISAELDVTNEDVSYLSASSGREIINGEHFFRVLMNGAVKLLLYTDKSNREHFAVMEKETITQLVRKETYIDDPDAEDHGKLRVNSHYRQQLANFVGECVPAQQFERLGYSEKEIRKVLQKYLACRYPGEKPAVVQTDRQMRVTWGVLAGPSYQTYTMTGSHQLKYGTYKDQIAPVIGIFMDVPLSRDRQKLSWNNELVYTNRSFSSSFPWYSTTYEADVKLQYVQLQSMIKYTYPKWKVRPYVNLGMVAALKIGGKDQLKIVDDGIVVSDGPALGSGREFILPFLGSIGVRIGKLHVEARYITNQNISPYLSLEAKVTNAQLIARYTLF